jgi:phosphate transport system substrate-binding protein
MGIWAIPRVFGLCVGALVVAAGALSLPTAPALADGVRGAGSTFAAPVINRWARGLERALVGVEGIGTEQRLDYEAVGSEAGMMRMRQPEIDFAAMDFPLPRDVLRQQGLVQFPFVIGGIAVFSNLPGIAPGRMRLNAAVLADVFRGQITRWNDARLVALNPDLALPDLGITVVHRSDGSGTTQNFTAFLGQGSDAFRTVVGSATQVRWPVGVGAEGSRGVIERVQTTSGAISYVEYGQVARAGLSYALIENRAGRFIRPTQASLQAAAAGIEWSAGDDFNFSLINAPGAEAYPITAAAFAMMHRQPPSAGRNRRTLMFFLYGLDSGATEAANLGYVPLPSPVVQAVKNQWKSAFGVSDRFLADSRLFFQ